MDDQAYRAAKRRGDVKAMRAMRDNPDLAEPKQDETPDHPETLEETPAHPEHTE